MFARGSTKAIIALAGLVLVAASCIADDPDPFSATLQPGDHVVVEMGEFRFMPRNLNVVAGSTVTITLTNNGALPHELMVGSQTIEGGGYAEDLLGQMLMDAQGFGFTQAALALQEDHAEDPAHDHPDDPADDHAEDPAADGDAEDPAADGDAEDPAADGHAEDPAADHQAEDPAADGHAEDPAADGHAEDPAHDMDMDEGDVGHGHAGAAITLEPGGEVTLVLNIPSDAVGDWEIGCFIEGHYEAGMLGTFSVSQPNA